MLKSTLVLSCETRTQIQKSSTESKNEFGNMNLRKDLCLREFLSAAAGKVNLCDSWGLV